MRRIVLMIFALLLLVKAGAQSKISGRVTDEKNFPLPGANIYLPELNKGTITNRQGEFSISGLPSKKLKIQFSFVGFNNSIETLNLSDGDTLLNIALTREIVQSQEVVVSGAYIGSQHENAIKIDVMRSRDILLTGTPNFMESLTKVPGVDMISKGQGISKPVIRGLSMNNILVMNNGIRIENYQFSEDHPLGIDGNGVERVEIIKGPASLLFGSDAIGGVLNFIKEQPAPTGKIEGDYKMQLHSNTVGINNSLGIKGASRNLFGGVRLSMKNHADYIQGGGNFVPNSRFNETTFNSNFGFTGAGGTAKLFYDNFSQNLGISVPPVKPLITEQGRKTEIWFQDLNHQMISSENNLYFGKLKWAINGGWQQALRKLKTTLDVPVVEMRLNTLTYDSKLYFPSTKKSEYILSIQGMLQNNRNLNNRLSQFLPDADISNFGVVGLVKFTLPENIKIQGGLRFDSNKTETVEMKTGTQNKNIAPVSNQSSSLSGSLGFTYRPAKKINFRVNLAKAYRVPNLSELTSNGMHGNRYEIGNPHLVPQNSYESDFSIHYHGNFLSFDLAAFYNKINDYIFITPTSDTTSTGADIYKFSQTNAALFGGEAGIHFHPKTIPWLHVKGTYTSVTGKQQNGNYLPFIPAQKFRYEVRIKREKLGFLKNPSVQIAALSALKQNKPSPYETATEGYTLVNLSLYSEVQISQQTFIFGISANNIFDTQYFDHLSTLKPLNYLNEGRNFSVSMKIPFAIK
jgi:iron complex outermembrane receptor protein